MYAPSKLSMSFVGMIGVTGLGFLLIFPILVGSVVDGMELDRSMVGWISASNIAGMSVGAMIATMLIGKISLTAIIRIGCLALFVLDGLSGLVETGGTLIVLRFLSGLGGGMLYAAALAAFSSLKNSIRAFSIYIICYCVTSAILLFALPFLIEIWSFRIGFFLLSAMALFSLFFSREVPAYEAGLEIKNMVSIYQILANRRVGLALLSYFLLQLGGGVMFAYSERIGQEVGHSIAFIGVVLSLGSLFALLGAVLVMRLGTRFGVLRPLIYGILLKAFFIALLFRADMAVFYCLAMFFSGLWWSFLLPYYQQIQAASDPMGRVVSMGTIVNMAGRSAGPALAAIILGSTAFVNVVWISIAALALSLLVILPVLSGQK